MPLVKAVCTNCGANLEVDNSKDAAICPMCSTPYIVEKAIHLYASRQGVPDLSSVQKMMEIGELSEADKNLLHILSSNPNYTEAWTLECTVAEKMIAKNMFKEAQTILTRFIEHYPDDGNARLLLFTASLKHKTEGYLKPSEGSFKENYFKYHVKSGKELINALLKEQERNEVPLNHQAEVAKKLLGEKADQSISSTIQEVSNTLDEQCFSKIHMYQLNPGLLDGYNATFNSGDDSVLFYEFDGDTYLRISLSGYGRGEYKVLGIENKRLVLEDAPGLRLELLYEAKNRLALWIDEYKMGLYMYKYPLGASKQRESRQKQIIEQRIRNKECIKCGRKLNFFGKCPNGCIQK